MKATLLAAIATVGLVGCVGGIDQGGGDPLQSPDGDGNNNGDNPAGADLSAAKTLFDTTVYPLVNAKCSGAACHSETATGSTLTRFVATDATNGWSVAVGYAALVGNFTASAAPILTHVAAGHQGRTWQADEVTKITAWLDKEVELRNGQGVGTGTGTGSGSGAESLSQATERVLSQFAGCMSLTNFQTANMANSWGNMTATNNQQCENCHVDRRLRLHRQPAGEPVLLDRLDEEVLLPAVPDGRPDQWRGERQGHHEHDVVRRCVAGPGPASRAPAVQLDDQPGHDGAQDVLRRHHGSHGDSRGPARRV